MGASETERSEPARHGSHEQNFFHCPLPRDTERSWDDSPLHHPFEWSSCLQSLTMTISKFDYPTALFWGHDFALLFNQAWLDAGGIKEQGKSQRGSLSPDAWHALDRCINGGKPLDISSHVLLRDSCKQGEQVSYRTLLSPIFDTSPDIPRGVMAQMLRMGEHESPPSEKNVPPGSNKDEQKHRPGRHGSLNEHSKSDRQVSLKGLGMEPSDNVALDEHPFFHRFAEMLPTGLAILDHNAQAMFVNQHFYRLTTHRGDDQSFKSWPQSIHPDDYERVLGAYQEAFMSQTQLRTEFRALGAQYPWRLLLLTPLGDENLRHVSLKQYGGFICSIVDISSEKSAEITQRQAAEEALERKQQQERFIDMISHEIRNPLSAMLHCMEDIDDAIKSGDNEGGVKVDQISEALETINLCISHQKNIVDDVLSYSKLDSSMLALTPKACKPDEQLRRSLKMFQPEFRKQDMEFEYLLDTGYTDLKIEWAMADLARVAQVLINLITNAIKFTAKKDGHRKITCKVSAAVKRPESYPPDVVFFSSEQHVYRLDATERPEWGSGEPFYIMVAVSDNGIGISDEGQKRLFERFRQATPKTGEIYGGSGLGLNISRKLVHLHGGEIGVASKEGQGTTFGFFFRAKNTIAPDAAQNGNIDQEEADERFRGQIRASGMKATDNERKEQNESLKHPKVENAEEEPEPDERKKHTQKVFKEAKKEAHDEQKKTVRKLEQQSEEKHEAVQERSKDKEERHGLAEGEKQPSMENTSESLAQPDNKAAESKDHSTPMDQTTPIIESKPESNEYPSLPHRQKQEGDRSENKSEQGTQAPSGQETPPLAPSGQTDSPHILLVEDNVINQRIVLRKLASKGFRMASASNGREAVDVVSKSFHSLEPNDAIDVILMDQEMPVMDGNAASAEIRKMEVEGKRSRRVPIIGVSANVREEQLECMRGAGMDACVTKPYKIEEMVGRIGEMLGAGGGEGGGSDGRSKGERGIEREKVEKDGAGGGNGKDENGDANGEPEVDALGAKKM